MASEKRTAGPAHADPADLHLSGAALTALALSRTIQRAPESPVRQKTSASPVLQALHGCAAFEQDGCALGVWVAIPPASGSGTARGGPLVVYGDVRLGGQPCLDLNLGSVLLMT